MGFSGITSAVGMAIESQFCLPPLSGTNPATVGVGNSNPLRYMMVQPGGGVLGEPNLFLGPEVDGDFQLRRAVMMGRNYLGHFRFLADPENLFYPFLGMFGKEVITTLQAASGTTPGVYQHQFQPWAQIPSFTVEEDIGDGTWGRLSCGALVQQLDLQLAQILTAQIELVAHRQLPNRYPDQNGHLTDYFFGVTPTPLPPAMGGTGAVTIVRTPPPPPFVDLVASGGGPLVFAGITHGSVAGFASAWLLLDNNPVAVDILEGSHISFEREIQSLQTAGSGFDPSAVTLNRFLVSGRLVALYKAMDLPQAAVAGRTLGLNFAVNGGGIGSTGFSYKLEVYLPNLRLQRAPLPLTAEMLAIDADFVALRDPIQGYAAQVTLVNTMNASALAGQATISGAPTSAPM